MRLVRQHHGLAIGAWSLSLLGLCFVTLGLNGNWWGYITVTNVEKLLSSLDLSPSDVHFDLDVGLRTMSITAHVGHDAIEKGYSGKTDTYMWGVLAVKCEIDKAVDISSKACQVRRSISSLCDIVHILLSISSLLISGILMFLLFAPSPVEHYRMTFILFGTSMGSLMSSLIIFEAKLKHLINDPIGWGIIDEEIHTTLAGIDHKLELPAETQFSARWSSISPMFVWISFWLIVVSLGLYILRLRRTLKNKKYIYDRFTLTSRLSMAFQDESTKNAHADPQGLLKSRRRRKDE